MANEDFEKVFSQFITDRINKIINKITSNLKRDITNLIIEYIDKSPEIQSMRGGKLQGELGFISPEYFISKLYEAIRDSVEIDFAPFSLVGNKLKGNLSVNIIRKDYNDLLNKSFSSYNSSEYEIPWLKWLLLDGSDIVVDNFHIIFGNFEQSRSKEAIMEEGGNFAISPEFQGSRDNNFITRSLDSSIQIKIRSIINKYVI